MVRERFLPWRETRGKADGNISWSISFRNRPVQIFPNGAICLCLPRAGYLHIQTIRRSDCVMPSFFCIRREAVLVFSTWPKGI